MGYTRYWERTDKPINPEFLAEVQSIIRTCFIKGIGLGDAFGENTPEVTLDCVAFNGSAAKGLDHESFVIDNNGIGFNFCKTARKPYDYAVAKALQAAKRHGLVTSVRSDGPNKAGYSDHDYLSGNVQWD